MTPIPEPCFDHLLAMTNQIGTFEHAKFSQPRPEHGYCTDDMARVLVVTAREPNPSRRVRNLAELSLRFLRDAQGHDGAYRNRMGQDGSWQDRPGLGDCWGRSVWALGAAAAHAHTAWLRRAATVEFERAAQQRSPWLRATAYATLGAAELLSVAPDHREARALLTDGAERLPPIARAPDWPWPEPRLGYANAVLPEAMIAAGSALGRGDLTGDGLSLLGWLLDHETLGGHLSLTPVGGGSPGALRPAFDQQPIEVAALAEACARAAVTDRGESRWADGVAVAAAWFLGENDGGHVMWDADTGAGFDGLQAGGVNLNRGAESTLAVIATFQHARRLAAVST